MTSEYPLHNYLTTTATITTQWFFFSCTINAAIAVLVNKLKVEQESHRKLAAILADVMAFSGFALGFLFVFGVPGYYFLSYFTAEPRTYHLMFTLLFWSMIAAVLGAILLGIALMWFFAPIRRDFPLRCLLREGKDWICERFCRK